MSFAHIRNQLKTKLQALPQLQNVYDYPNNKFSGYPAGVIRSMGNDSDYETVCENERHYVFTVYIYQEKEFLSESQARRRVESLADLIIDTFDKDEFLAGISMPPNKDLMGITPALSEIVDDAKYIIGEMNITVKVSFNKKI